jgi:tRNA(Arg) A34 adenosine deaminase TadA
MKLDHEHYMDIALELSRQSAAQGNRPTGALIVDADGTIIAQGGNRVYTDFDPTAHGEMVVIREACAKLKKVDLSGCTLYTAMEPCPMCCWAILETKISRVVLGGRHAGIGRKDIGSYSVETLFKLTGRSFELVTGVKSRECEEFRLAWIAERAARGLGPR